MTSIFSHFIPPNTFRPPDVVCVALEKAFGTIRNVEWTEEDDLYEAVFYCGETEYIASFNGDGKLLVTKTNLPLHTAKPQIARQALLVGELMNLIEIKKEGKIYYDVIARDKFLDRYYLFLDEDGNLIEKQKL